MALKEEITKWLEANTAEAGCFPVEVEISDRKAISVFIDSMQGITVGTCAIISRKLSDDFGERLNGYSLEVSSSGLDRPLTHPQQFVKNVGKGVMVDLKDGRTVKGVLDSATTTEVFLSVAAASKKEVPQAVRIPFSDIKDVKLVISFK